MEGDTNAIRVGALIDGFAVERRLHVGGMATLWRVTCPDITMPIVMKVPTVFDSDDPATVIGFEMEQMILPLIGGPHVPRFVAAGSTATYPYLVMEYIEGPSLLPKLGTMPLPVEEIVGLGARIAEALDALHRQFVLHLDIKPSNVVERPSGEIALVDFGLSRHEQMPDLLAEELRLPVGTGPYISPEQIRGDRTDPRSDLFSLGVLLYHLLTAQRPFGYPRSRGALRRRLWRDPPPPVSLNAACPPWLQELILRCLEPDPRARHPTAAQLAFDFRHPDDVKLTARAYKQVPDGFFVAAKRWYEVGAPPTPDGEQTIARRLSTAPIVMAAVDLMEESPAVAAALKRQVERVVATTPGARLACVNVLKMNRMTGFPALDPEGRNMHLTRLTELKLWAQTLRLGDARTTFHVLEASDPAAALLDYAVVNSVDQIIIGAQARFSQRRFLGSIAARIVAEAPCSVTVVRDRTKDLAGAA